MKICNTFILLFSLFTVVIAIQGIEKGKPSEMELLGKKIFFDQNLSLPPGQSCAACHGPEVGWSGPDAQINIKGGVYPGAVTTRHGNRKPPSSAYAGMTPKLHRNPEGAFVGGLFWDGRATGWEHGDPLTEQAMGPFLNPLEQNIPDIKHLIQLIQKADYAGLFLRVWGNKSLSLEDPNGTFLRIAKSIAAYERSKEVNPFSSRFDAFWVKSREKGLKVEDINESNLKTFEGLGLNGNELKGLMLFNTKGLCSQCHILTSENSLPPVFTDYTYDNIGIPRNPDNPFYQTGKEWNSVGENWKDKGLGEFLETTERFKQFAGENIGKHRVPTLRNVDRRPSPDFLKAFMHNGFFKTLKDVVHFYNTRDMKEANWPEPEIKENLNITEMGNLKLTPEEENAVVEFMKTLSDQ